MRAGVPTLCGSQVHSQAATGGLMHTIDVEII